MNKHSDDISVYEAAKVRPFAVMESIREHVGALQVVTVGSVGGQTDAKLGTAGYHIEALQEYTDAMFVALIELLPEQWTEYDG